MHAADRRHPRVALSEKTDSSSVKILQSPLTTDTFFGFFMATDAVHVGFLLWPNLTQLDMTGPAQVLSRMRGARLHFVWKSLDPVPSDCGLALSPTTTLADCPQLHILVVPGGTPVVPVMRDQEVIIYFQEEK